MKNMQVTIMVFVVVASVILLLGHAGLYMAWIWIFGIKSAAVKWLLGILLGTLAGSFIIGALLVHWRENVFTRTIYIAASIWLGIAWYMALATVASLLLSWLILGRDWNLDRLLASFILLLAAFIASIYGIWNAINPRLKYIEFKVKNLPDSWRNKKIVHLSDLHLGVYHRRSFMRKVVRMVNEVRPAAVFITGDLFDGAGKDLDHFADPIKNLKAEKGVYYISGNHETYISVAKSLAAVRTAVVRILDDEIIKLDGMQILGISYPQVGEKKDYHELFNLINSREPCIVLYHEPKGKVWRLAKQASADIFLSGHTHAGQLWPFNYITRAVYGRQHHGVYREGFFSLFTSSGVGTWGPPMRIGNIPEIGVITLR